MSGLFDPEAFEQIPGQLSMEQSAPSEQCIICGHPLDVHWLGSCPDAWQPPCGSPVCAKLECCQSRSDCPCGMGDER